MSEKLVGQIWRYDGKTQAGYIVTRDNHQFRFSAKDYVSEEEPHNGFLVEFKAEGQRAREIRLLIEQK